MTTGDIICEHGNYAQLCLKCKRQKSNWCEKCGREKEWTMPDQYPCQCEDKFKPGDIYEDCLGHPTLCTRVTDDGIRSRGLVFWMVLCLGGVLYLIATPKN
jgi:hypothetical protein